MKIIKNIVVPTGNILVVEGEYGLLEMLSLGDYGKSNNLIMLLKPEDRCKDFPLKSVKHTNLLPLETKWVITISSQYGCGMGCNFCDVPEVKWNGKDASLKDMVHQVLTGIKLHPEIVFTKRLNIHFARMGEPTFNPYVLDVTKWLKTHIDPEYHIHPVVSTIMPKNHKWLKTFIHNWMRIKNRLLYGEAGLQLSINSTDEKEREIMFNNNACSLEEIAKIMEGIIPNGRKITLNFAVAKYTIDPQVLLKYFDPEYYVIKLTPMHKTTTAKKNGIKTPGDYTTIYPYIEIADSLRQAGYDVLVFIASLEEDESSITCGNTVLTEMTRVSP